MSSSADNTAERWIQIGCSYFLRSAIIGVVYPGASENSGYDSRGECIGLYLKDQENLIHVWVPWKTIGASCGIDNYVKEILKLLAAQ